MTEFSYNGWSASPKLRTRPLVVAGEPFSPGVRDHDDVHTVLQYVAEQMHRRVEPIVRAGWHQADDWGYSYRTNRNDPDSLSCHASGTAIDYNATRHPNGVPTQKTFSEEQIREVHQILREVNNVVRWGGDFRSTPDAMHFEIFGDEAAVKKAADKIRGEDDMFDAEHAKLLQGIDDKLDTLIKALSTFRGNEVRRDEDNRKDVKAVKKAVTGE